MAEAFEPESDDMSGGENDEDGTSSRAGVLSNMGVMLPILMLILILAILIGLCVKYNKRDSKLHNLMMKVKKKVFYNSMLRFVLQSYLKTSIGAVFALKLMKLKTTTDAINSALAVIIIIILCSIPIFFYRILDKNRAVLPLD